MDWVVTIYLEHVGGIEELNEQTIFPQFSICLAFYQRIKDKINAYFRNIKYTINFDSIFVLKCECIESIFPDPIKK